METKIERICYMSQGRQSKMYTLWSYNIGSIHVRPQFVKNLSTNRERALSEAKDFANRTGRTFSDESMDELRPIKRIHKWTDSMVTFGKNYGMELAECDDKFIKWVAIGCPLFDEKEQIWCNRYFGGEKLSTIAQTIAVEKGLGVIKNNKFFTNEQYARVQEREALQNSLIKGHHYNNGDRVELSLKLINKTGYESEFGFINIYKFVDSENRTFTYKGSQNLIIGDEIKLKATIKHGEYKGTPETYIQRIKF